MIKTIRSIITGLILLSTLLHSAAQTCLPGGITFERQIQLDNFATDYPGCTEIAGEVIIQNSLGESITNLDGLVVLEKMGSLTIQFTDIVSIHGLRNLTTIESINIKDNDKLETISGFDALETVIDFINISENLFLESLHGFSNVKSIDQLLLSKNPRLEEITAFSSLKNVSEGISIFNSMDGTFDLFPNLETAGGIFIVDNHLSQLYGFDKLKFAHSVNVNTNENLEIINGFHELIGLEGDLSFYQNKLVDLNGFENLRSARKLEFTEMNFLNALPDFPRLKTLAYGFQISKCALLTKAPRFKNLQSVGIIVTVGNNPNLTDVYGMGQIDYTQCNYLQFFFNQQVQKCDYFGFCQIIDFPSPFQIANTPSCSPDGIRPSCDGYSKVIYNTYFDINENQIFDDFEYGLSGITVNIDPINNTFITNEFGTGFQFFQSGATTYEISVDDPNWVLTTSPATFSFSAPDSAICEIVEFGFKPINPISEMASSINAAPLRCDTWVKIDVSIRNIGTTITNGIMWLEIPTEITDYEFTEQPDSIDSNKFGWFYENLHPGQEFLRTIDLYIPQPSDLLPIGTSLYFSTASDFSDQQGSHQSEPFSYKEILRCSFDPNDKLVHPDRSGVENLTLFEERLTYTIRFQNTGNDVAYDLFILDTLDSNLDLESFEVLSTSHPQYLQTFFIDDRVLKFDFVNINLPDSTTDLAGSNGYVTYHILANEGLEEKTVIENAAGIYFDSNPPIATNTTVNTMVSELISGTPEWPANGLNIYPNPSTGQFLIEFQDPEPKVLEVIDLQGNLLFVHDLKKMHLLDLSDYPSGIYYLKIKTDAEWRVEKLIKI